MVKFATSFFSGLQPLVHAALMVMLTAGGAAPVLAACPDDAAIDAYIADFAKRPLSKSFGNDISLIDAECAKRKLGQKLRGVLGKPIGYKAGFTNPALQQRFGVDGPKWGYMVDRNFVDIIAVLPADFGSGMKVRVQYIGLPGDPQVTVDFNERIIQ